MFVFYDWPFPHVYFAKNVAYLPYNSWLSFQRLCRLLWGYHICFVDSNHASNNSVIPVPSWHVRLFWSPRRWQLPWCIGLLNWKTVCFSCHRVTIRPGFPGHALFFGICPGVRVFENLRFVRVFGPICKYIRTLPIAKAYDGMRQRKLVSFQYKMSVTSQNAILVRASCVHVYWTKVNDAHITNDLKWCQFICVICIWFCIVSIDPRLVIFAYLQVCEKVSSFSTQTIW